MKSLPATAALLVLLFPGRLLGFELLRVNDNPCARQDQNLFWPGGSTRVDTGDLPGDFPDVALDARQRWNDVLPGFGFRTGFGAPCRVDGVATMVFSSTDCAGRGLDSSIVGITRSVWNQNGELMDADVIFNVDSAAATNRSVFLEVAMHELGHVLGLDHSDACGASGAGTLMKSSLGPTRLTMPQADDIAGAETIYPASSGGVPEGLNQGCTIQPVGENSACLPLLLVLPLLVLAGVARRH